jgi:hypothetical protein
MRSYTPQELHNLPKCKYQPFIPCTCDDLPKNDEEHRKRKCLACCLVGIQDALVQDKVCGAMLCYDNCLLVLADMGLVLKL